MSRTNIDIDDDACRLVMERYGFATKREAVNFALRALAAEPLEEEEARAMRGSGWVGDLGELRESRVPGADPSVASERGGARRSRDGSTG